MANARACSLALLVLAAGACTEVEDEPDVETVASPLVGPEGQSEHYQSEHYQSEHYQSEHYQGTSLDGATVGGAAVGAASVSGTSLVVWYQETPGGLWQQRFPDQMCVWNAAKTTNYGCQAYSPAQSPLIGTTFTATFADDDTRATFSRQLRIVGVAQDFDLAGFPLRGHSQSSSCMTFRPVGGSAPVHPACTNPKGCKQNCDVWLYDVQVIEEDGTTPSFCAPGHRAIALSGTYDTTGELTTSSTKFTFACTNGTIAKCTRWGYRPYGFARKECNTAGCTQSNTGYALKDYHQACVRAAMADYCAIGHTFTKNGTLVDVWDYDGGYGFLPRTQSMVSNATAFELESGFDRLGAHQIDHLRYAELARAGESLENYCADSFEPGDGGDVTPTWVRPGGWGAYPTVWIDSTTACSHSERTVGKWLHENCSSCTRNANMPTYCTDPLDPKGWDSNCVSAASQYCPTSRMTTHSECSTGPTSTALPKYSTGCTLRVCLDNPSCCTSAWTDTCVTAADQLCRGGKETIGFGGSFCHAGTIIFPGQTLPSANKM